MQGQLAETKTTDITAMITKAAAAAPRSEAHACHDVNT
jgi:hypothetical protein